MGQQRHVGHRGWLLASIAGAATALGSPAGLAAVINWINATGGQFGAAANWQGGVAPGPVDDAVFALSAVYTVDFPFNQNTQSVTIRSGTPTFTINTFNYTVPTIVIGDTAGQTGTLNIPSGNITGTSGVLGAIAGAVGVLNLPGGRISVLNDIEVGDLGSGTMMISAGGQASSSGGIIGSRAGSTGSATIRGATSRWTTNSSFQVAMAGQGTMTVDTGGLAQTQGPLTVGAAPTLTGSVTVSDAGSRLIAGGQCFVGAGGTGTITVANGAMLQTAAGTLANSSGSSGTVTITGAGSAWSASDILQVGQSGPGVLNVLAGGSFSSTAAAFVGVFAGSTGNAKIADPQSTFTIPAQFQVGREVVGTVSIENGAVLSSGTTGSASLTSGLLGLQGQGDGRVTVTGAGSRWNQTGSLAVGWGAKGTLTVSAGGVVSSTAGFVGRNVGSLGVATVTGAGSRWNNSGELRIGLDPTGLNTGSSSLAVLNGGVVQASAVRIGTQATLSGDGEVQGSVFNNGTTSPGPAVGTGTLTLQNNYSQSSSGRLAIAIAGSGAGQYDTLFSAASVMLDGNLTVTLLNGYDPPVGSQFPVVSAGGLVSGSFVTQTLPPLAGGKTWQVQTTPAFLILRVNGACPGDYNGDGRVDFLDLNIVLSGYGVTYNFLDLNQVLANYTRVC